MKDDRLMEMQVFRAIVDHRGFTAAGHALKVSQPFISQTFARLERRLGIELLHRTTRKQRLTADGERYLVMSREILAALDDIDAGFHARQAEPSGDLRISAPLAFGTDQILPLLPPFAAAYPKMKVHLSLSDAIVSLIDENVDVAIRMGRLNDSLLKARKLCDLRRIIVAAPAYVERHGEPEDPGALKLHNCLEWHGAHEHLNRWPFQVDGGRYEHVAAGNFRSSNGLSLAEMCFAGVGIMRMAEHLAVPAINEGRLVRLLEPYEERRAVTAIHAVFLAERRVNPRIGCFVDHLAEAFKAPAWESAGAGTYCVAE